jgi:hypothetical protein
MLTQHCDSSCGMQPIDTLLRQHENQRYYAKVPALSLDEQSRLIEQVIHFALDTLGVRHLDVRVLAADRESRSGHAHAQPLQKSANR